MRPARTSLTEKQLLYIDYLLDPDRGSKTEFADDNHVEIGTLIRWEKHYLFKEEWAKRAQALNLSPARVQQVIDAVWQRAVNGDINAARTYLGYAEKLMPKSEVYSISKGFEKMTDEELLQLATSANAYLEKKAG